MVSVHMYANDMMITFSTTFPLRNGVHACIGVIKIAEIPY